MLYSSSLCRRTLTWIQSQSIIVSIEIPFPLKGCKFFFSDDTFNPCNGDSAFRFAITLDGFIVFESTRVVLFTPRMVRTFEMTNLWMFFDALELVNTINGKLDWVLGHIISDTCGLSRCSNDILFL